MILERDRRILYVDSNEAQRYAMCQVLESAGFVVVEARSAAEALTRLQPASQRGAHPEALPEILAVILDVVLPDMSSAEFCRRVHSRRSTSGMPIVQISSGSSDPARQAPSGPGRADAYLSQPIHATELLSLVDALIRAHEVEETLRFQAAVSAQLTSSLDYKQTLRTVESAFTPYFADNCVVFFRGLSTLPPGGSAATAHAGLDRLSSKVRETALQVCSTGQSRFLGAAAIVVPLEVGRRRLGALVFTLEGERRRYSRAAIGLAEDLADRAALALQNADLFTAQQTAQTALVQSEKLAAAGRLSAAIAHEINNPLEAITNLIFLIDTSDEVTPTIKTYAEEALSELSRLTHIARQSLGFHRELSGPVTFDLNESVEDTLNIYLKRFEAKHIEIERSYTPGLRLVAVKGEIRQVIANLLVNAYDALPSHGKLRIETAGSHEDVCLRVLDNGHGIPEAVLSHIFEPFYTTKENSGTGLGLWVSENIVQKHGGRLEAESRTEGAHRGTSFTVTLPRTLREAA